MSINTKTNITEVLDKKTKIEKIRTTSTKGTIF